MGTILDYIDKNNENGCHCYRTKKFSLDDNIDDQITQEGFDRDTVTYDRSGRKYAETDEQNLPSVQIPLALIKSEVNIFTHFLDGSRRTYKIDDISIGNKIFPIVAGQIVVGCCQRKDRDNFKKKELKTEIVISLPVLFSPFMGKKRENYGRAYAEDLTTYLQANNKYAKERDIKISKVLFYDVDGNSVSSSNDKNRFLNSAIARIQNNMTDEEQFMVQRLCDEKQLSDTNYLIKDGSIQYNPNYSNYFGKNNDNAKNIEWNNMRANYQHVIGISKSFDPTLLSNRNSEIAQIIANLKPFHRTKVYRYVSEQSKNQTFAIWYLRLRDSDYRQTNFSDVVKCELLMLDPTVPINTSTINWISAGIIREAFPVCYGKDSRWANHLYPVYLTESFCKTQYIDKNIFLGLF